MTSARTFIVVQGRDYDRVQALMSEALHYTAVLSGLGQAQQYDTLRLRCEAT